MSDACAHAQTADEPVAGELESRTPRDPRLINPAHAAFLKMYRLTKAEALGRVDHYNIDGNSLHAVVDLFMTLNYTHTHSYIHTRAVRI